MALDILALTCYFYGRADAGFIAAANAWHGYPAANRAIDAGLYQWR